MTAWCRRVAEHRSFHQFVMAVIVLNALILGLETIPSIHDAKNPADPRAIYFKVANWVIQALFIAELVIRFGAAGIRATATTTVSNMFHPSFRNARTDPAAGPTATVARLARVLRIARLVEVSAEMKLIVATIVSSMRSLTKLILMIVVLLYSFAIIGYHLFEEIDPENWGSLGQAMWTLFQTMTLEGWTDKQQSTFKAAPHQTWVFYATFLILATYFVMNLFVAIVVNNLQELKEAEKEAADAAHPQADLLTQIDMMRKQLEQFEARVRAGGDSPPRA
jgi:voltage-gated sodium channel